MMVRFRFAATTSLRAIVGGSLLCILAVGPPMVADDFPAAEEPAGNSTLAQVGEWTLTVAEFQAVMEKRGGGSSERYATPETRRALLDEMVEFRALVEHARAEGFDRRPDVVAAFEQILVARYKQERLDPQLEAVEVQDWEVESFYERHKQEYALPERFRAAFIRIGVPADASEEDWVAAEARAAAALEETRALGETTPHFGEVAVRYSDDRASRYRGGVLGWLNQDTAARSKLPPEAVEALLGLERPGEIAPALRAADGVYLVRLVERREMRVRGLDALEDGFRNQIRREKQRKIYDEFLGQSLTDLDVQVDESLLETIEPPESSPAEKRPPVLPAG